MIVSRHECTSCGNVLNFVEGQFNIGCSCGRKCGFKFISKHEVKEVENENHQTDTKK